MAEHVVGVPRTPNRDATCTTLHRGLRRRRGVASQLELSSDDGGVAERQRRTGAVGDCDAGAHTILHLWVIKQRMLLNFFLYR